MTRPRLWDEEKGNLACIIGHLYFDEYKLHELNESRVFNVNKKRTLGSVRKADQKDIPKTSVNVKSLSWRLQMENLSIRKFNSSRIYEKNF